MSLDAGSERNEDSMPSDVRKPPDGLRGDGARGDAAQGDVARGEVATFGGPAGSGSAGSATATAATATAATATAATATAATGTGPRRALTEQLFATNYPKLAGWVRRLVNNDDIAHEIASEAFVRLLSRWTSPASLENPQSYLYMIATNLVRDHWRKAERERRAMRNVTAGTEREPTSDPAQDVDVRQLIQGLPTKLRDPFLLHYYAGFGVREISLLLKRPEGTIKADLYHARSRLREAVNAHAERGAPDARR